MRILTLLLLVVVAGAPGVSGAQAAGKAKGGKRAPVARPTTAEARPAPRPDARGQDRDAGNVTAEGAAKPEAAAEAKPTRAPKAKVYTFSGLDVEGKLKTPQLLYFLNRVKLELDTTSPEKRSFLKELEKTSDDKGL